MISNTLYNCVLLFLGIEGAKLYYYYCVVGDADIQKHEMFSMYLDPCCEAPGRDHSWAVGTELRQATLFSPQLSSPHAFRRALINHSLRRKFVLDANVLVSTVKNYLIG
jgi:hypothetical protein